MNWQLISMCVGGLALFLILLFFLIRADDKHQKYVEENTIEKYTKEQLREMIAEKLGVKPSQIKFMIVGDNADIRGIRVVKEGFEPWGVK